MVGKGAKEEFEHDGVAAVRRKVEQSGYWAGKRQQAIEWLNQQAERKQRRDTKALLTLARRTARDTRLAIMLLGLILLILIAIVVALLLNGTGSPMLSG